MEITLQAPIRDAANASETERALRDFVDASEKVGRTEFEVAKETGLSLVRPERFRTEIINAIAADTQQVRTALGARCAISLDGLASRIQWERVSASELLLYIPYSLTIEGCAEQNG